MNLKNCITHNVAIKKNTFLHSNTVSLVTCTFGQLVSFEIKVAIQNDRHLTEVIYLHWSITELDFKVCNR
jgi:hypothetical protein